MIGATCTEEGSYDEVIYCTRCNAELSRKSVTVDAIGHTEETVLGKAPTCTETGLTEGKKCSVCHEVIVKQESIPVLDHSPAAPVHENIVSATCGLKGSYDEVIKCEDCGKELSRQTINTDKTPHTEVVDKAVAPTCTTTGLTEGKHCSVCKEVLVAQTVVKALGHTEVVDKAVAATCTTSGLTEGKHCSVCKEVLIKQEILNSLGHDKVSHEAKSPTCTEIGWDAYETCSRCDYTTYVEKSALDHDRVSHEAKAPTCTEIGWDAYETCSRCDYTTYVEKAKLGHNELPHEAKAPTCTEIGWDAYETCSRCDYTTYVEKSALDHDRVPHEAKAPTCTEIGWDAYETCSRCDYTTYVEKSALDHDRVSHDAKAPTCTEIGWDAYETCSRCDYTTYVEKSALGHTEVVDKAVAPTCTATGLTEGKKCSVCEEVLVAQEVVKALSHTEEVDKAVAPTCTTTGLTEGKHCSVCNEVLVAQEEVEKVAHTPADAVVENKIEATCKAEGLYDSVIKCSVCSVELSRERKTISKLAHTEVTISSIAATCTSTGLTEGKKCSVCEEVLVAQTVVSAKAHSYTSKVTDPTCMEEGYTTYTCSVCNYSYIGNKTSAIGQHAFESKFTGNFLYRVGNLNEVSIKYLFEIRENTGYDIVIENVTGTAKGEGVDSIKFTGTGIVRVKISNKNCNDCAKELLLEVIDAKNITSAEGTTTGGNFVLLCNIKTNTYVNYWNATVYGNGFEYSLEGAPTTYNSKQGHGILVTKNTVLDNLVIIGDIYNSYGAYTNQDYYNSAVDAVGPTTIQNCYIANCAAPVLARADLTIINTTLYGGTVANLIIRSGTVTLEDVTTANFADGRNLVGMGIVIHTDATESAKLILNGTLKQYNFISEANAPNDANAKNLYTAMFDSKCSKYHFGTSPNRYVNAGIISMTALFDASDITDNANTGYEGASVTVVGVNGYVYTQLNTNGSVDNSYDKISDLHYATTQGTLAPNYMFDYTNKNYQEKQDGSNDYCYEEGGKVHISMDEGDVFNWDTSILTVNKVGNILSYTVSMNGDDYTGKSISFNTAGEYKITYTYTDVYNYFLSNGNIATYSKTYTKTVVINVSVIKATTKHAEFTFGGSNTSSVIVTIDNKNYVMPNVSGTSATIGSTTVNGQTIYYPIVEIVMSDNKTSHTSAWYAYFPVFSGAVTIKDYQNNGTGDPVTFGSSTTTMPSGLSIVGDPTQLFKYQSSSTAGASPVVKNNILVYSSPSISAKRSEYNTVIQYSYQDNAGTTYYYYIGYHAPAQSYSSICLSPDTLITLADGTKKEIQHLRVGDEVLAWNFYTGKYEIMPVSLLQAHSTGLMNVLHLYFEDGTELKILGEHGVFDADLNTFVFIDEDDVEKYIGHSFVKQDGDSFTTVKLIDYAIVEEYTTAYTILSADHYNVMAEGMFTVTPAHVGDNFFNPFDVGEDMKYDEEAVKADIEKYGLYTYEDFDHVVTYEQFVALNLGHFKVSVGKGYITYDGLIYLIENFVNNEDFNVQ